MRSGITTIKPMLAGALSDRRRLNELLEARAYAYGGCVIQDLGYYPFGSHFFSNLLHYVRTGDFVERVDSTTRRTSTSTPSRSARSVTMRPTTAAIRWPSTARCR